MKSTNQFIKFCVEIVPKIKQFIKFCVEIVPKTRQFIKDTIADLHKCTWPTRDELFQSTLLVITATFILAVFVAVVDWITRLCIDYLTMQ